MMTTTTEIRKTPPTTVQIIMIVVVLNDASSTMGVKTIMGPVSFASVVSLTIGVTFVSVLVSVSLSRVILKTKVELLITNH